MSSDAAQLEEQKKAILPFLIRAQEVNESNPKIAYYCRLHAVEQAFVFKNRAKEINSLVSAALSQMESDVEGLALDRENDQYYCESFAIKVFGIADRSDRAGRHDKATATSFLASSYFFDVLNHWGPLLPELSEKQKYAAWRAAELNKAIREGRAPMPPSTPKDTSDHQLLDPLPPPTTNLGPRSSSVPHQLYPPANLAPASTYNAPPPAPPDPCTSTAPYSYPSQGSVEAKKPPVQMIVEAQKMAKHAVSSLNFDDVPSAINYLKQALRILQD